MIVFENLIIVFSLVNLFEMIKGYKRFYCIYPIIAVFDLVMVVPVFLEMLWGIPNIPYPNFVRAMEDETTMIIYCFFVLFAQVLFFVELKRIKKKSKKIKKSNDIQEKLVFVQNFKYKKYLLLFCYIIIIICVLAVLMSPMPSYYLSLRSVHFKVYDKIVSYSENVIRPLFELLIVAIITLKLLDSKNDFPRLLFRGMLVLFFTVVNGKRTYLMIIVAVFFLIDLLRKGSLKKIALKYTLLFGLVAVYFVEYMYITDKISYNSDWYYELQEYIFRSMHVRFSIYATLHPNNIHILDYSGQSILYNLLFFIPRMIWASKPWPYIDYYIMGVLNLSSRNAITFHMPASYYPEFVSNFGLIGLPLSMIFTIWMTRYFDKRKTICKLLGIALIALLNIYYYNDLLKIVAFFVLYLCISEKYKFKFRG